MTLRAVVAGSAAAVVFLAPLRDGRLRLVPAALSPWSLPGATLTHVQRPTLRTSLGVSGLSVWWPVRPARLRPRPAGRRTRILVCGFLSRAFSARFLCKWTFFGCFVRLVVALPPGRAQVMHGRDLL